MKSSRRSGQKAGRRSRKHSGTDYSILTDGHSPVLVAALAAIAIFSQMFLVGVTITNADFHGEETPARDYLAPAAIISPAFDQKLTIIGENLAWSFNTAFQAAQQPALAFLGVDEYKFGQPRYTSLASQAGENPLAARVLGAYTTSQ